MGCNDLEGSTGSGGGGGSMKSQFQESKTYGDDRLLASLLPKPKLLHSLLCVPADQAAHPNVMWPKIKTSSPHLLRDGSQPLWHCSHAIKMQGTAAPTLTKLWFITLSLSFSFIFFFPLMEAWKESVRAIHAYTQCSTSICDVASRRWGAVCVMLRRSGKTDGIIQSLRLENTTKIISSNHQMELHQMEIPMKLQVPISNLILWFYYSARLKFGDGGSELGCRHPKDAALYELGSNSQRGLSLPICELGTVLSDCKIQPAAA